MKTILSLFKTWMELHMKIFSCGVGVIRNDATNNIRVQRKKKSLKEIKGSSPCIVAERMENRFVASGSTLSFSKPEAWAQLRRNRPSAVAVDTEGTHIIPPLMVQVAYRDARTGRIHVILEAPSKGQLSKELTSLLAEPSIAKVFCDVSADIYALGTPIVNTRDVQEIAATEFGAPSKMNLGALGSRFVFAGAPVVKNKNGWKYFAFLKGRPSISWPSLHTDAKLCKYAAADAWMTLEVFDAMRFRPSSSYPQNKSDRNSDDQIINVDETRYPCTWQGKRPAGVMSSGNKLKKGK